MITVIKENERGMRQMTLLQYTTGVGFHEL